MQELVSQNTFTNLAKTQSNMKLVLDEWIIREVIDTLYMARTALLGITGLDSTQETAKKSANETAITRRISKAIDIIQKSEKQKVDLEKEINDYMYPIQYWDVQDEPFTSLDKCARHFYELGLKARKEE